MTFGEALIQALSFFWSPLIVILLTAVVLIASLAAGIAWVPDYPIASILAFVLFLVSLVMAIALGIYISENALPHPLSWEGAK